MLENRKTTGQDDFMNNEGLDDNLLNDDANVSGKVDIINHGEKIAE